MSRILATGITGTIGRHFGSKVEKLDIDLSSLEETFNSLHMTPADSVLHAAAIVGPSIVASDVSRAHSINVRGARYLATAAREKGISRFVYLSSSHIYAPSDELLRETSPVRPSNVYAEQKLEAEMEITEVFKESPEKLCIVRIFSVLDWDVPDFTLGGGIKKLAFGISNYKLSNAQDLRDFLTPRTIAKALINIVFSTTLFGIVNLSTGVGTTVREASRRMLEDSGYNFPEERVLDGRSTFPVMIGDNSKLLSHLPNLVLSWTPSTLDGNQSLV